MIEREDNKEKQMDCIKINKHKWKHLLSVNIAVYNDDLIVTDNTTLISLYNMFIGWSLKLIIKINKAITTKNNSKQQKQERKDRNLKHYSFKN